MLEVNNKSSDNRLDNKIFEENIVKCAFREIQYENMNSKINNKRTTSEHKQECKEIYITLFNKYKEQIEKENAGRKFLIISECKKENDYLKLTAEEQDELFIELMSIEKKIR